MASARAMLRRVALDAAICQVIADLQAAGIALDGPTAVDLYSDAAVDRGDVPL